MCICVPREFFGLQTFRAVLPRARGCNSWATTKRKCTRCNGQPRVRTSRKRQSDTTVAVWAFRVLQRSGKGQAGLFRDGGSWATYFSAAGCTRRRGDLASQRESTGARATSGRLSPLQPLQLARARPKLRRWRTLTTPLSRSMLRTIEGS